MIRTEEGRYVRENPEITEKKEKSITTLKVALRRAEILGTLKDHPGWECAREILSERIRGVENKLKNFKEQDQRINDLLLQEKNDLEFLHSIVEDFTLSAPGFEAAIHRMEKELIERKQPQGV